MDNLFSLWLERGAYALGDEVRGRVLFPDPRHSTLEKVRSVKLQLRARVHGSGDSETLVVHDEQLHVGPLTQEELPFEARLPERGPVSWQGRHVKVNWEVVAELDIPWAIDPKRVAPFEVRPRRRG
ncbi:MAG: sporulation protein [Myxococcota bacterium]